MSDEQIVEAVVPAPEQEVTATPDTEVIAPEVGTSVVESKTFTQEELDAAIGKRLAREQRKWEREQAARVQESQARKALVKKDARVFGISLAFEPQQFVGSKVYDDYCLYVREESDGLVAKQLLPPEYPPPSYRERHWYSVPKKNGKRTWSEPYLGQRADDTPMLTYSCPFDHDGQFSGVVATDLSIKYFRALHSRLEKKYLGSDCKGFVISRGGTIIYHPNPQYEFPSQNSSFDRIPVDPDFQTLWQQMQLQETGFVRGTDFDGGQPATFYFARIPATNGYFVLVQFEPTPLEKPDSSKNR